MAQFLDKFGTESGLPNEAPTYWQTFGAATDRYTLRPPGLIARFGGGFSFNKLALPQLTSSSVELLIRFAWLGGGGSGGVNYRGIAFYIKSANDSARGMMLMLYGLGDEGGRFVKRTGSTSDLASNSNFLPDPGPGKEYLIRVQGIGSELKAKAWAVGDDEPASWSLTETDSEFTEGFPAIAVLDDRSAFYDIRWIGVGTDGDPPPNGDIEPASIFPGSISVAGNATAAGGSVDHVLIFRWPAGPIMAQASPEQNGDWSALSPAGEYGVTYIAEGCQPITHGPYLAEAE